MVKASDTEITHGAMLPMLRDEVDAFAFRYGLTVREKEVVHLLVDGVCSVADIAEHMQLSRNTVHNHFKKLFRRTNAGNKSALMALFIRECVGRQAQHQTFLKWPNVLLVSDSGEDRERLRADLDNRGMRVYEARSGEAALSAVARLGIDVVVTGGAHPTPCSDLHRQIVNRFGRRPPVLDTHALLSESPPWPTGASAESDVLVFGILKSFIDTPYERSRLLRVDTQLHGRLGGALQVVFGNLGFGGAFAALPQSQFAAQPGLAVGGQIDVELPLCDDEHVRATGQIVWRRLEARRALPSGVGIRFLKLSEAGRKTIETFVRRRKLALLTMLTPRAEAMGERPRA